MTAENCGKCGGSGRAGRCYYCEGAGGKTVTEGGYPSWQQCMACGGSGIGTCDKCGGSGTVYLASIQTNRAQPFQAHRGLGSGESPLAGIWTTQVETNQGKATTELIFRRDKSFRQKVFCNGQVTIDAGTYEAGAGYLHFFVDDHEPKVNQGRPASWARSWIYFYSVADENTMILENRNTRTKWTYYRIKT